MDFWRRLAIKRNVLEVFVSSVSCSLKFLEGFRVGDLLWIDFSLLHFSSGSMSSFARVSSWATSSPAVPTATRASSAAFRANGTRRRAAVDPDGEVL